MSRKPLGEQINETAAELIILFVLFAIILLPIQLSQTFGSNIGGLAALIILVGLVILLVAGFIDGNRQNKKMREDIEKRRNPHLQCDPYVEVKCPSDFQNENIITFKSNGVEFKKCPYCKTAVRKKVKKCPRCDYNFK